MQDTSGERLLWRTMERLDVVESLLLKPGPSGLGDLVENLEESWRELCALELAVRAGTGKPAGRAELEDVRGRLSRLAMLLDHARQMVDGWQAAGAGTYRGDGSSTVAGQGVVGCRVDKEG